MRHRTMILLGVLGAGSVMAQTTPDSSTRPAKAGDEIDEIVVTALKVNTSVQRTPAAVTVISGSTLEQQGIETMQGVQNLAPSAHFGQENTALQVFIRGVGSQLDYYWIPESTAINMNGVYIPRYASIGNLFDIDSIQVLPGPQGVLYGRSAGGGVVVTNSNRPTQSDEGSANVTFGNYNLTRFEGMGNVAINDQLAVRAAATFSKHDGYESYGLDADNSYSVRLSALYKPISNLSIYAWGTRYEQTAPLDGIVYLPYIDKHNPWYLPPTDPVTGLNNTTGVYTDYKYQIFGTEIKYDVDAFTVQYTGSAMGQLESSQRIITGNIQQVHDGMHQYTQDIRFSGDNGPVQWLAGANWYDARSNYYGVFGPHQFGDYFPSIKQRSISEYAQATWSILPTFRFVAGVRNTRDTLELSGNGIACFGICFYSPIDFDHSWSHVDWKAGVEWDATSNVMAYANVQTGYVPGTLNTYANSSLFNQVINPQTLLAYTAGVKTQTSDHLLTVNLETFYYSYKNLIIQAFNDSLGENTLYNAPRATINGAQLTSSIRPTGHDTFSVNGAYTHGWYGNFVSGPGAIDLYGLQTTYTPTWTATLDYDHSFDLPNGGVLDARVDGYFSSKYWGTFDHTGGAYQGGYGKTDASIAYNAPNKHWTASIWAKNIQNVAVHTAISASGYASPYSGVTILEPPRTFGLTIGFKY